MHRTSTRRFLFTSALATAALGSQVCAQWTTTVLEYGSANRHAGANAVHGLRQGGYYDNGYSYPRQWLGTSASGITLAEPAPDSGSQVHAITATHAFGDGYVHLSPTEGYYAGLLWNEDGSSVTVFPPPAGYYEVQANGAGGNQQVGSIRNDEVNQAVLWTGTPQSIVILAPSGASYSDAYATDGVQQVGYVYMNDVEFAALWTGTASSLVNLHPAGAPGNWLYSFATGVSDSMQVGGVGSETESRAAAWQGTAASFVDIHPAGMLRSSANGISKGHICGSVSIGTWDQNVEHAAYWSSASSSAFVDLHAALPSHYEASEARGIWSDGAGLVRIVGEAYNTLTGNDDAILWTNVPVLGACCNGTSCSATLSNACAGTHAGAGTTCTPVSCCAAPIGPAGNTQDCDGDLLIDSCVPLAADCNNNSQPDACDGLDFSNHSFAVGNGPFTFNGSAIRENGAAVLTPSAPSLFGSIVRPPLTSGPTQRLRAVFDFRVSEVSSPVADGFSFSLMDATLHAPTTTFGEDGPAGSGVITVKFNTFENYAGEGHNSMYIRYNDADVAGNTTLPQSIADSRWHRVLIDLTPEGRISVSLTAEAGNTAAIFTDVQLPGYVPFRANIGLGGRTGGSFSRQEIANIRLGVNNANDPEGDGVLNTCQCVADFNDSGMLSVQDIFDFLEAFFGNDPRADFNSSGEITVQDIFDYLAAYFAGENCN